MQGNTVLGVLLPIVFCGSVLTLVFLWMRRNESTRHKKAKQAFTEALAAKNIKIDPADVAVRQGSGGVILCQIIYRLGLFASGEYHSSGQVFVRFYPKQENDPDWSFWYPTTPHP